MSIRKVTYEEAMTLTMDFWGGRDDEVLSHDHIDSAIESELQGVAPLPETIELYGYVRDTLPAGAFTAEHVIEHAMECLDEEYADPDGYVPTKSWPELTKAAEAFVAELRRGYVVWQCSRAVRVDVDVAEWVKANR